jgi:hypothetical protein
MGAAARVALVSALVGVAAMFGACGFEGSDLGDPLAVGPGSSSEKVYQ